MEAATDYTAALKALLGTSPDSVAPCAQGGNNRVLRVDAGGKTYLAKCYFKDARNRLGNEWQFLRYAEMAEVPSVPRPIACDAEAGIALYSFFDGITPKQVTADMIRAAGKLLCDLNRHRDSKEAQALPNASESCFSAREHIDLLEKRLERLERGEALPEHKKPFREILAQMQSLFAAKKETLERNFPPLTRREQWLSPSDFGFHNTLFSGDSQLRFIDFEYAGWDDPTKLLCDFFLHPGVPVDAAFAPVFLESVKPALPDASAALARARLLYPLLGLRWCCITLNVFVPEWAARRAFSDKGWKPETAQAEQLAKAERLLAQLQNDPFGEI